MEHKGDGDTSCNWCTRNGLGRFSKEVRRLGNRRTTGDHPNHRIVKTNKNTEKSPGELRRLFVAQIPMKDQSAPSEQIKNLITN